jgi:hypothetical protein
LPPTFLGLAEVAEIKTPPFKPKQNYKLKADVSNK